MDDPVKVKCKCGGLMRQRQNKSNGNTFYGCSNYPKCKLTMTVAKYEREYHVEGCHMVGEDPDDSSLWNPLD